MEWKHFPRYHLWEEFTGHRWIPLTKASEAKLWRFLWSAPEQKGWANHRDAGDLRHHRAHYNVTVMCSRCACWITFSLFLALYEGFHRSLAQAWCTILTLYVKFKNRQHKTRSRSMKPSLTKIGIYIIFTCVLSYEYIYIYIYIYE